MAASYSVPATTIHIERELEREVTRRRLRRPSIAPRCERCRKHRTQTRTPDVGLVQGRRRRLARTVRRCPSTSARSSAERDTGLVRRKDVHGSRAGSSAVLSDALLPSISRQQHVPLSKEQPAARYAVTPDLARSHPSVNGANLYPTQLRDFAFPQKF